MSYVNDVELKDEQANYFIKNIGGVVERFVKESGLDLHEMEVIGLLGVYVDEAQAQHFEEARKRFEESPELEGDLW